MTRWRLTVEFDGGPFSGWQRQDGAPSIQQSIEEAIEKMTGEQVRLHCAGRTDAGVHGLAMTAHVDIAKPLDAHRLREGVNALLRPDPIAVLSASEVDDEFHARFSCTGRRYLYRILNRRAPPTLLRGQVWHIGQDLDVEAMAEAAKHLEGNHDFTTFRSVQCQSDSPVKTLDSLTVERVGEEVHFHVAARSFLHHQVRSMVGTLSLVGRGQWNPADVKDALEARDRQQLGLNAPPDGLYFVKALYPED
ncbi:tRNA pseudouridine(38-40) synthase TruA [Sphingomicrobium sediminis]|uniref:tRNA pseudouridine synthase A n=1 Tax=Sphingomicrobium sediminis TaxID=2950949 RepID=A0A9X2EFG2_9SPHN|nr:tRNA pseudouridine(38-40) synthase TruA [Sphingomicrobium sediminis]MCM8556995.1 tRNA pseudouridine(38-40) synthase TruA [Sphingomicrobium sediminis]